MTPRGGEGVRLWLALAFAAALFTFRLGSGSFWDVDEPRYVQAAREVLASGDPVTMHLGGRPWVEVPPLWMWVEAASGAAAGFTEWTARLPAAAFGVVGVAATYALGREWFGPRTGLLSALVLASMLEYVVASRLAVPGTAQVAWLLLALLACSRGYRDRRPAAYLPAFLWLGLLTLTRGPVALVLPVVVWCLFLWRRRALGLLREIPWAPGVLLFLAIAAPWYTLEAAQAGWGVVLALAGGGPLGQLLASPAAHVQIAAWGLIAITLGAVPWTAFLPAALAYHFIRRWQDGSLLVVLWCGVAFLVAASAGGQFAGEMLPIFPVAAIGIGRLWEEFLFEGAGGLRRTLRTSFALQIAAVLLLGLASATFATLHYPREFIAVRGALVVPLAILVAGAAVTAVQFRRRRYTAAFFSVPATMAVFVGILYTGTLAAVEAQKPIRPLAQALQPQLRPGDRVVAYRIGTWESLAFYTNHAVEPVGDPRELRRRLCAAGRVFLVANRDELAGLDGVLPRGLVDLDGRGATVMLLKPPAPACPGGP